MRTPHQQVSKLGNTRARRIQGQGMTEYIIVVAVIALGAVAAIGYFGTTVNASFVSMGTALTGGDNGAARDANTAGGEAKTLTETPRGLGEY